MHGHVARTRARFKFNPCLACQFFLLAIPAILENSVFAKVGNEDPIMPEMGAMGVWTDLAVAPQWSSRFLT